MVEEKKWFESKTIWGALVAVAASVAGGFGFSINEASQLELTNAVVQLVAAMGAMVALYGRLNATQVIS